MCVEPKGAPKGGQAGCQSTYNSEVDWPDVWRFEVSCTGSCALAGLALARMTVGSDHTYLAATGRRGIDSRIRGR